MKGGNACAYAVVVIALFTYVVVLCFSMYLPLGHFILKNAL
jgi:hypothetical protein